MAGHGRVSITRNSHSNVCSFAAAQVELRFWALFEKDLREVFKSCLDSGILSGRAAENNLVLEELETTVTVAIYLKIIAKCLSKRLKECRHMVLHTSQTSRVWEDNSGQFVFNPGLY